MFSKTVTRTMEGLPEETVTRNGKYFIGSLDTLLHEGHYIVFRVTGKIFYQFILTSFRIALGSILR
jgi:hypothetical protein